MELAHAALHRLLQPYLPGIETLPEPQRNALATVFGLDVGAAPDRFLVGPATLTLLAEAARTQPLLCVIDDAQWLDHASIGVLTFVARRLLADRVGMLFCVRDQSGDDSVFDDLPELVLRGLDESDARTLLEHRAGSVDPHVARRVIAESGGNPLAVIEFVQQLSPAELRGDRVAADRLSVSGRIEANYLRQVSTLSPAAQTILLLASADPSGEPDLLRRAAARLDIDDVAAKEAEFEASGFLTIDPVVAFRHALVRSAVCTGSAPNRRRQVHRALADELDDATDSDRRSWHLAAATAGHDEQIAQRLEASAGRARARGGHGAESAMLIKAAELTPEPYRRGVRLLSAAEAALRTGDHRRCQALLSQAEPLLTDPYIRARAERVRGATLSPLGRPDEAPAALMASALALGQFDPPLARETWTDALSAAWLALDRAGDTSLREVGAAMLAAAPATIDGRAHDDDLRTGIATRVAIGHAEAVPILRQAIAALRAADQLGASDTFQPMLVYLAAHELWDVDSGRIVLQRMTQRERERGGLMGLWLCLHNLAYMERWAGRLAAAQVYNGEAQVLARTMGLGQSWKFPGVEINALWGHDADLREAVERLEGTAGKGLLGASTAARDLSLTVHALSRGHYADAYRLARAVNAEDAPVFGNQILPELVEAATRFGKMRIAEEALRTLTERAQTSGTDWARGLLARSQGLLASNGHAEAHYVDAIASLDKARMPLDHARAHLLYGEWLRRRRRRSDAVEQLTRAHGMFVEMGTEAFADRAAIELRAAGAAAHSRVVARKHALTPQEEQVAQLAAHSMTNREIATALFISESTVAHHLKKVFQKLGLRSRRELKQRRFGTD